jgi:CRISPR-associated protein Cas2
MRGIICYDFSDDRARSRFVKILQKYGTRMQYSVFEFKLDKETWSKLIQQLHEKKFLNGNYNIIIIPITESVHNKIVYLGNMFLSFDYDTLIYSGFGIDGIGEKHSKSKYVNKFKPKIKVEKQNNDIEKQILDKIFKK